MGGLKLISVNEYLEAELESSPKHEYLGGAVYAMSGGRNLHNRLPTCFRTNSAWSWTCCGVNAADRPGGEKRGLPRHDEGFVRELWEGLEAVVPLPEIGVDLPLAEIYADVEFPDP